MNDCSFCLSKNLQNAIDVKLLDLDDNEFGKVSYMEMLVDVLPTADFQKDNLYTCEECVNSFWRFYAFKQKIQRNLQQVKPKLLQEVKEFITKEQEQIVTMKFMKCMMLVPASKENIVCNFIDSNPFSIIKMDSEPQPNLVCCNTPGLETLQEENEDKRLEISKENTNPPVSKKSPRTRVLESREPESSPCAIKRSQALFDYTDIMKKVATGKKFKDILKGTDNQHKWRIKPINYDFTRQEKTWLFKEILNSKMDDKLYRCSQCKKKLSSFIAIRYHIASQHIIPKEQSKAWVRNKIREGKKFVKKSKGSRVTWSCVVCCKFYINEQGLRYHLKSHWKDVIKHSSDDKCL